jgi:hypothetical protein
VDIAQILLQGSKPEPALACHYPKIENVARLSADLVKLLETQDLVVPEKRDLIYRYSGLRSLAVDTSPRRALSSIIQAIRSKPFEAEKVATNKSTKGAVAAVYAPASDKLLISYNN